MKPNNSNFHLFVCSFFFLHTNDYFERVCAESQKKSLLHSTPLTSYSMFLPSLEMTAGDDIKLSLGSNLHRYQSKTIYMYILYVFL